MAEHGNAALVRTLYAAFEAGDIEGARRCFADDVVWHEPPGHGASGEYVGFDGVLAINQRAAEAAGGALALDLHDVLATDDHVVVLQQVTAREGAEAIRLDEVIVAHVRDGRLAEIWVSYHDAEAPRRLFGG